MKKVIIICTLCLVVFSCNEKKTPPPPAPKQSKIVAAWLRSDDAVEMGAMLRVITSAPKLVDSLDRKWEEKVDTLWGRPVYDQFIVDSTGKPILDKDGNKTKSPLPTYYQISKDSVFWRVENVEVDSILKKSFSFPKLVKK